VRVYVTDANLRPLPTGVPGELCFGGVSVGAGYIDDPERTASHFQADRFVDDADARIYRTGDKVRFLPDRAVPFSTLG